MKSHPANRPTLSLFALLWRCVLLAALAGAAGLVANAARPDGLPLVLTPAGTPCPGIPRVWWDRIDRQPVGVIHSLWLHQGASFLDGREHEDVQNYPMNHVPGAYEVYYSKFTTTFAAVRPQLPADKPVVVYGTGEPCDHALRVAKYLVAEYGYHVYFLTGGFPAWEKAGYPELGGPDRGAVGVAP
jgi:rhodanese-related sulfurtransferase